MSQRVKKILVTGGCGFIGSEFVRQGVAAGRDIIVVDSLTYAGDRQRLRSVAGRLRLHVADICDSRRMKAVFQKERPAAVVHFAAETHVDRSIQEARPFLRTNVEGTLTLMETCRRQGVGRFLHISTDEVYGEIAAGRFKETSPLAPNSPYAASKAAADLLLQTYRRQFGFPLLTVRATNVYGARQQLFKIIPRSVIYIKLGRTIPLHGGGVAVKSYIHIRDVSRGELAILNRGQLGSIYHLSPDLGIAVREVVRLICERLGVPFERATAAVEERPGQDAAYVTESAKARQQLGWAPRVGIEEGLAEVVAWVEANWEEICRQPLEYQHKP